MDTFVPWQLFKNVATQTLYFQPALLSHNNPPKYIHKEKSFGQCAGHCVSNTGMRAFHKKNIYTTGSPDRNKRQNISAQNKLGGRRFVVAHRMAPTWAPYLFPQMKFLQKEKILCNKARDCASARHEVYNIRSGNEWHYWSMISQESGSRTFVSSLFA